VTWDYKTAIVQAVDVENYLNAARERPETWDLEHVVHLGDRTVMLIWRVYER
jgi:hypothetical protein